MQLCTPAKQLHCQRANVRSGVVLDKTNEKIGDGIVGICERRKCIQDVEPNRPERIAECPRLKNAEGHIGAATDIRREIHSRLRALDRCPMLKLIQPFINTYMEVQLFDNG